MSKQPKPITITLHAEKRLAQRRVSHNQAIGAIRKPSRTMAGSAPYTQRYEKDFPNRKCLVVIIEEQESEIRVVTAFWGTN